MAGIHDATAVEFVGNISKISTKSTPYDLTKPATQNCTENAPNTTSLIVKNTKSLFHCYNF